MIVGTFTKNKVMPMKLILTGMRFNMLTVLSEYGRNKDGKVLWECVCDCGNKVYMAHYQMKSGNNKSCGCWKNKLAAARVRTHGMSKESEYHIWKHIKGRCTNETDAAYHHYGGRGITVCDRWINSYENFILDMGKRPTRKHSIERINNNLGYSPNNCKWGTTKEQSRNRRNNVVLELNGVFKILQDWAIELGVGQSCIAARLKKGMSFEEIYSHFKNKKTKHQIL